MDDDEESEYMYKFFQPISNDFRFLERPEDFKETETHTDWETQTSTKEVTWTARELNCRPKEIHYSFCSPPFFFQNAKWCLRLYPNNFCKYRCPVIGLSIVRLGSRLPRHRLQYHLKSLDSEKTVCIKTAVFDEKYNEKGDMTFISRWEENSDAPRNIIRVACQVSLGESHFKDASSQTQVSERFTKDVGALCKNFKNLLLNGPDHDVVLKVMDKEFRAHQNILRARSSVMDSMLSHDMIEKNSGAIDIPDCDPSAFEQFLLYVYCGEVDVLDADNMLSLYYIADKYDMGHLKEECREFIKQSLSSSNITNVIQTALDHSDADILRRATDYFVKEMNEILPTVEWLSFLKRNPVQANELIIKATKNMADLMKKTGKS